MGLKLFWEVAEDTAVQADARFVLSILAVMARDEEDHTNYRIAFPSESSLAKHAGKSDRQIRRIIAYLVEIGRIQVSRQSKSKKHSNRYYLMKQHFLTTDHRTPMSCDKTDHRTPMSSDTDKIIGRGCPESPGSQDMGVQDHRTSTSCKNEAKAKFLKTSSRGREGEQEKTALRADGEEVSPSASQGEKKEKSYARSHATEKDAKPGKSALRAEDSLRSGAVPESGPRRDYTDPRPKPGEYPDYKINRFDELWDVWPKKAGYTEAKAMWNRVQIPADVWKKINEDLLEWKRYGNWTEFNGRYCPRLDNYLAESGWKEDPPAPGWIKASRARIARGEP